MDTWTGISGTSYTSRQPRGLAPWNPRARLAEILSDVQDQLEAERDYWPLTCRHEGYRLVEHAGYPKTDATFNDAEKVILRGRRAGLIPWEAIDDGRSEESAVPTWETEDEFLGEVPDWYSPDLLGDQDALEVWVEAAGMVAQASAVARGFTVPVLSSSGFRTTSAIYALAERTLMRLAKHRRTVVLLVGDLDSDGLSAIDSTVDDAWAFLVDLMQQVFAKTIPTDHAARILDFEIVALTGEHVERFGITTKPGGKAVRRGDYDGPAVQLEALDAADFATILTEAIEDRIDRDLFDARASLRDKRRARIRRRTNGKAR